MDIKSFEESYSIIEKIVEKWRYKWTLKAVASISFEDVKQIILIHISQKWETYDQNKKLEPWVARVTRNQFINVLRNNYLSTASPCSNCEMNLGGDECKLFKIKGPKCDFYRVWLSKNKFRHECRLPLPLENHSQEVNNLPDRYMDVEKSAKSLHILIKEKLTGREWEIYKKLYVEQKSEEQTAKELNLKTSENGRDSGYGRFSQVRKKAVMIAKQILAGDGLET